MERIVMFKGRLIVENGSWRHLPQSDKSNFKKQENINFRERTRGSKADTGAFNNLAKALI